MYAKTMASVRVALKGPSRAAIQAKIEDVARQTGLDVRPMNAEARFEAGAPVDSCELIQSLHGPSLSEDEIRGRLAPFEDEAADPTVGVRFVVL
jgi:hypothetical protein